MTQQSVTLTLTIEETNLILKGLGKLALEESFALFINVRSQADTQLTPPVAKEKEA